MSGRGMGGQVLDVSKMVGILHHQACGSLVDVGRGCGNGRGLDVLALAVGLDYLPVGGRQGIGQRHFIAPGHPAGHESGFGQAGGAVVHACVGDFHAIQVADHGLELENHLQGALAGLRLVRGVRREELSPGDQGLDDGRDEVMVGAGAQE